VRWMKSGCAEHHDSRGSGNWTMDEKSIGRNSLRGPPGFASSVPRDATPEQCVRLWLDLMDACDQFLLAGLRREIGPDGDLEAAYRRWHKKEMEKHDRMIFHLAEEFNRRAGS
jgi:hypothetical protein